MKRYVRDAVFDCICDAAKENDRIVLLTADADAFGLQKFKKEHPDRFLNVGIAEQAMITMSAGLALAGKQVYVYGIAPFVTLRVLEQIKVNLCAMNLPVCILGLGVGTPYGFDGPSHQSLFDVGIMSCMPNMRIYNPIDYPSAYECAKRAMEGKGPSYLRIDKSAFEDLYPETVPECGFGMVKGDGNNKTLVIATGICTHYAMSADIDADVLDLFDLVRFDRDALARAIETADLIVLYEEQWKKAGLSIIISDLLIEKGIEKKIIRCGIDEHDCMSHKFGSQDWLHREYGIDMTRIEKMLGISC